MTLVGCDLRSRKQQVAVLDTTTGEILEQELVHEGDAVERFYRALRPPVTIGIETTGYTQWFHALMHRLGHTVLVGEAAKIRAMVVRKTKTDRRDARHLLDLLRHDRFPTVWIPDPGTRDLRALVAHRVRLVRMRTMVKNGLQAIALNHRLALRYLGSVYQDRHRLLFGWSLSFRRLSTGSRAPAMLRSEIPRAYRVK
jgi:transposase